MYALIDTTWSIDKVTDRKRGRTQRGGGDGGRIEYIYREKERERERQRERERDRETERERETDRQTDRQRQRNRDRQRVYNLHTCIQRGKERERGGGWGGEMEGERL